MKNILYVILSRLFIALLSAGLFSFLIQIAVFRYTRYLQSPIPAQDIFGLPSDGFQLLVSVIWFFPLFLLAIFWFIGRTCFKNSSSENERMEILGNHTASVLGAVRLLRWSVIGSFLVAVLFIVYPRATENALRYLGHGGVAVCYETNEQLADYTRDVVTASKINLSNNIRAQLVLLSGDKAYVKLLASDNSLSVENNVAGGRTIKDNYVVKRAEYLSAGYHIVKGEMISGDC